MHWAVFIESPKYSPEYLHTQIDEFIKSYHDQLSEMSEDDFAGHQKAIRLDILQKPKTLSELTGRYWDEIVFARYRFQRRKDQAAAIKLLTRKDIIGFSRKVLLPESPTRCLLSMQALGKPTVLGKMPPGVISVTNFQEFRESRPLFPLVYQDRLHIFKASKLTTAAA